MYKQFKKYIAILLISLTIVVRTVPVSVYAEDSQPLPTLAPIQTEQPSQPSTPSQAPENPSQPSTTPTQPSAPGQPTLEKLPELQSLTPTPTVSPTVTPTQSANVTSTGTNSDGQNGGANVTTGDATNDVTVVTNANENASGSGTGAGNGSASVVNDGNGAGSANIGSANSSSTTNTNQDNGAHVNNGINAATITGQNSTSFNVGDSSIKTGDANVTGTAITNVNTNLAGVMVSEFNVADDHVGDLVLDFNKNCISGCADGKTIAANTNNGANSTNTANTTANNSDSTTQNNNGTIGSTLTLAADSGNNNASFNTGGNSDIKTGNANVEANVLNFANNNLAGNVILGVVNIFGVLHGDIILTPEAMAAACGASCASGGTSASNTDNGAGSTNNTSTNTSSTDAAFQNNDANIGNNLVFDANTGKNNASFNTNGASTVESGDSSVTSKVLNIANSNIDAGNVWLVLVNQAGKWIGHILGAPEGSTFAGDQTLEFAVDDNGDVTATNSDNGAGSTNNVSASETQNSTTTQNNTANVQNNLNLSANTGSNSTSYNTGGSSNVKTGDAKIVANIVNFVNNNIKTSGKLIVTVVNVFGKWFGDFVGPGQHKENHATEQAVGGPAQTQSVTSNTSSVSVTPVPTTQIANGSNGATNYVNSAHNNGATNIAYVGNVTKGEVAGSHISLVKGTSFDPSYLADKDQVVRINLAWLILALPLFIIVFGIKKFIKVKQLFIKK